MKKSGMLLAFMLVVPVVAQGQPAPKRPAKWATPVEMSGLPNLHKVNDVLYRGAQPSAEGMRNLQKMGVKTVVNLRSVHSDRDELEGTKLAYVHIVFNPFHAEIEDVDEFIKIMADPNRHPVFVHCKHGADRTGTMAAFYRIVFQGWSKDEAIREMKEGGYGFHSVLKNMLAMIRNADIKRLKKVAGPKK
jgi:protein tyrosine/serine phosphatase